MGEPRNLFLDVMLGLGSKASPPGDRDKSLRWKRAIEVRRDVEIKDNSRRQG